MRPFTNMGGNALHFADVNQLYNDHILVSKTLKKTKTVKAVVSGQDLLLDGVRYRRYKPE